MRFYVKKCKIYGQNTLNLSLKISLKFCIFSILLGFEWVLSINLTLFYIETQNLKVRLITETVLEKLKTKFLIDVDIGCSL